MANLPGIAGIVIQITFVARKPAQYPARKCREKISQVSVSDSILRTTSWFLIFCSQDNFILMGSAQNTSVVLKYGRIDIGWWFYRTNLHGTCTSRRWFRDALANDMQALDCRKLYKY